MPGGRTGILCGVGLLVLVILVFARGTAQPPLIQIAAASSLRATLPKVIESYTAQRPDHSIQVTYGSSGTLAASIERGAPYDLFLAADYLRPQQLLDAGLVAESGVQRFATSHVVYLARTQAGYRGDSQPPVIAIPNPRFAPYGQAAKAWLDARPGFGDHSLVFADSVANAAGLYRSGAVDGVFLDPQHAKLLAGEDSTQATPLAQTTEITLTASVMRGARTIEDTERFVEFLRASWAQAIE